MNALGVLLYSVRLVTLKPSALRALADLLSIEEDVSPTVRQVSTKMERICAKIVKFLV